MTGNWEKLTDSPKSSPLSEATLSDTDIADIRLGCVHMILQAAPRADSISDSKMNCGICVVLPQPVSPEIITTWKRHNQTQMIKCRKDASF